ncbi:toll/interleukin-1 receptor domain-containing protein [Pseudomonas aeruginosa]|uniref:toll/interleukin-1 receptor domain-containing protein n=1 Tax=Pseudomonas aeruginosa TaxID=287 RepID=UPI0009A54059|nr:toll/interleukin-1 receptor domain-containing protein [Pseudomonas aeruginosa]MBX5798193.1 toll/interleukin-1 receptor domain-containing protein [Pseudomonas aeruginosa]MCW5472839.1 toll/interleukin-1 receptor domain-containing protein [Pseudomonas aeruginosa]MCW5504814.1 toll/interleukin-1 receptor domain-containing protein [Pseudomonas aeruginosa]MCY0333804.1 toll/interleukin-1 receptor domain-containing protein [Pseudomonas aeruginosa]MCY0352086.1 toll/interleukin-1 receptor domain-conta
MTAPKVFISYSHDSQEHKQWVLGLATRLRSCGVDAVLDQWDIGPGGDLPNFMEKNLSSATRILMICTDRYVQKANSGEGGVGYEKMIVTADLMRKIDSARIIPIIRQQGTHILPTFLSSKLYINISTDEQFETGFDQLLRELLNAPLFVKPPLGTAPHLPAMDKAQPTQPSPLSQFMLALCKVYEGSFSSGAVKTSTVRSAMGVSKLLFDHALDLAVRAGYINSSGTKEYIFVQGKGREEMMKLLSSSKV